MSKPKHATYSTLFYIFVYSSRSHWCVYHYFSVWFIIFIVSEKAVKRMCEERKQMLQKIIDNDEQWEKAKEEATQVIAQHSVTQTKLEEQEQLTFMEEQRARVSDNMLCAFLMCSPHCMYLDSDTFFSFELITFSLDENWLGSMTLVDERKIIYVVNKYPAEQVKDAFQDLGIHALLLMISRRFMTITSEDSAQNVRHAKSCMSMHVASQNWNAWLQLKKKHTVQKETSRVLEDVDWNQPLSKWRYEEARRKKKLMTQSITPHLSNTVLTLLWLVWMPVKLTHWHLLAISIQISQICLKELYNMYSIWHPLSLNLE